MGSLTARVVGESHEWKKKQFMRDSKQRFSTTALRKNLHQNTNLKFDSFN
jgi:hypothetical protein